MPESNEAKHAKGNLVVNRARRAAKEHLSTCVMAVVAGPLIVLMASAPVNAQGPASLFVVGTDGTGLRAVASSRVGPNPFHRAAYPSWSPDGRMIAFTAFDSSGRQPEIRVVPAEGGPSRKVAEGVGPSWSHDGSRLAFMRSGKPPIAADWSRLGRNEERLAIVRVVGDDAELAKIEDLGPGLWPRWSPTDDRLAFASRRGSSWDIYVRSADGLNLFRLTDDPSMDSEPFWTPDGSEVVFLSNRGVRWDLFRAPADGSSAARRLTNHPSREDGASLSPDASRVAFTDQLGRPNSQILLLDLASETALPLLPDPLGDRDPCWSPDGRFLAFASRRPLP